MDLILNGFFFGYLGTECTHYVRCINATTKSILCMQTYNSSKKYNVNYQQVQQQYVLVSIFQAKEYPKLHENFHCRLFVPNDKTIV